MTEINADQNTQKMRIAKYLSHAGLCSRRAAEDLIFEGRVCMNGKVLDTPAVKVGDEDTIEVDGKTISTDKNIRLFIAYKKRGLVTTHKDEKNRPTLFDSLPSELPRLISVGRLDMNTEGLILLTNNGELANYLESPETGWRRRYKARVYGNIDEKKISALEKGLRIGQTRYGPIEMRMLPGKQGGAANSWAEITLREGKNREIRNVIEHLGGQVSRLIRLSYGPFQLGNLKPGDIREVPPKAVKEQLPDRFRNQI